MEQTIQTHFSKKLISWYLQNKRDLPWRETKDPYLVWLSEIILQQTRIAQGIDYFLNFRNNFPTVFKLSEATEDEVLKMWQGLGYYSRARNLHKTAQFIVRDLDGVFPNKFNELKKLKGIGDYTASAISSICFDEKQAAVDGNVYRVLSRFFNITTPIDSSDGIKEFKAIANELIDEKNPGDFNEALMELGATVCTPKNFQCTICPLKIDCLAFVNQNADEYPVKTGKIKRRTRYFNFLVFDINKKYTVLTQRQQKDIWKNLYEFPLLETQTESDFAEISEFLLTEFQLPEPTVISLFNQQQINHQLTHQIIKTKFWIIETKTILKNAIEWNNVSNFAVPIIISNFLEIYQNG